MKKVVYSDENIKFEVSEFYYTITVGKQTWYWIKETGEFDGHSSKVI